MINGLTYIPNLGKDNDIDLYPKDVRNVIQEFSICNHDILLEVLNSMSSCNVILEIGVSRNGKFSSTYTILSNKKDECIYVGVDIEDKTHIYDYGFYNNNTYTLKISSNNVDSIMNFIEDKSSNKLIDLLIIDGYHSVNQVLNDWRFTNYLSNTGIIILHDTNVHPGPVELLKAIDLDLYEVNKYCEEDDDWGIAVIKRK